MLNSVRVNYYTANLRSMSVVTTLGWKEAKPIYNFVVGKADVKKRCKMFYKKSCLKQSQPVKAKHCFDESRVMQDIAAAILKKVLFFCLEYVVPDLFGTHHTTLVKTGFDNVVEYICNLRG